MRANDNSNLIVLLEQQCYWRELYRVALTRVGFTVLDFPYYDYPLSIDKDAGSRPTLIILGCARIAGAEQEAIKRILSSGHRLLLLSSTTVPRTLMHQLFSAGVLDVAEKPPDQARFVETVRQAIASSAPRDEYEAVAHNAHSH